MTAPIYAATLTGLVNLLDPDPKTITLDAMAHGLGKLDRWAGALEVPFCVAQHSGFVAELFCLLHPELRPWSLWARKHDGHEYLLGDIITPSVKALSTYVGGSLLQHGVDNLKRRIDVAIELAFELPEAPAEVHAAVAEADAVAAHLEWLAFMPEENGPSPYKPAFRVPSLRPKSLAWPDAAAKFKADFERELDERAWERV